MPGDPESASPKASWAELKGGGRGLSRTSARSSNSRPQCRWPWVLPWRSDGQYCVHRAGCRAGPASAPRWGTGGCQGPTGRGVNAPQPSHMLAVG